MVPHLRDIICERFEKLDGSGNFARKKWNRAAGGGGEISLMNGKVFEKRRQYLNCMGRILS